MSEIEGCLKDAATEKNISKPKRKAHQEA